MMGMSSGMSGSGGMGMNNGAEGGMPGMGMPGAPGAPAASESLRLKATPGKAIVPGLTLPGHWQGVRTVG